MAGARRVKGYPITRDELLTLGGAGFVSSLFFGFGGDFIFRSYDLQANLDLSPGVAADVVAKWTTREFDFWYIGLVLLFFGLVVAAVVGAKIWSVIRSTEHPNE
jgi:hypothetical protein